jgi:hypothetical protein
MYKKYQPYQPYKRTPVVENIADYADYKVLAHLTKPRALIAIKFVTNDPDGWTIDKIHYKIKSGEITINEGVNAKSLEGWIDYLMSKGFERN